MPVHKHANCTKIILDLGEKAPSRHEVLDGAYYLRLAEFFMLANDPYGPVARHRSEPPVSGCLAEGFCRGRTTGSGPLLPSVSCLGAMAEFDLGCVKTCARHFRALVSAT
jgi:hypothetical protein